LRHEACGRFLVELGVLAVSTLLMLQTTEGIAVAQAASRIAVSVGGLRVVGPGVGENGSEQRPFNEGTGTAIVLLLKAPKGVGLVDLDEDSSVIESAADDKGTDLLEDASFGPFPEVVKDGSAGLMEIRLGKRPAAGSAAISAEGALSVTSATGTRPLKASNVALVEGKTFKIGTTVVTVAKVEASDDSQSITLNLPRSAMKTIKAVRFLDAKGAEIESDRVGSGYFNDQGEFDYRVKTTAKSVTVACDVWQGLKTEKVPFKLTAGLGL
jgi:hypothetical protein